MNLEELEDRGYGFSMVLFIFCCVCVRKREKEREFTFQNSVSLMSFRFFLVSEIYHHTNRERERMTITDLSRVVTPYNVALDCVYSMQVAISAPMHFAYINSVVEGYVDSKIPSDP